MKRQKRDGNDPEARGLRQLRGESPTPGHDNLDMKISTTLASSESLPSSQGGRRNKTSLVLATSIMIVGVGAVALSRLVIGGTGSEYYGERGFFASVEVNGYFAVAAGIGMMLYYLSLGQSSLPQTEQRVSESTIEGSFFRRMEPSVFSGVIYKTPVHSAAREDRVGSGVKAILYLLSVCIPAAGFITGAILYSNPKSDRTCVGKTCMIVSAASLVVIAALGVLLFVVILPLR